MLGERIPTPLMVAQDCALENFSGVTPGVRAVWERRLKEVRQELAGESPSTVEKMLAHHAALCWLRLAEVELLYTLKLGQSHTLTLGAYYDKRLSMAQRRFTRACETLGRVRMKRRRAGQIGAEGGPRGAGRKTENLSKSTPRRGSLTVEPDV